MKSVSKKTHLSTSQYIFTCLILVLIIITFVFSGVFRNTETANNANISFGSYANTEIEFSTFSLYTNLVQQSIQRSIFFYMQQFNLSYEQAANYAQNSAQTMKEGFNLTVQYLAMIHEAEKSQLSISEKLLNRTIVQDIRFQENNTFSSKRYDILNAEQHNNLRQTERSLLMVQHILSNLRLSLHSSPYELSFFQDMIIPQRKFAFVLFSSEDYPEALVQKYAQEHKTKFEQVALASITVNTENEAKQIYQKLETGEIFTDLISLYSQDSFANTEGDRGQVFRYSLENTLNTDDIEDLFTQYQKDDFTRIYYIASTDQYIIYQLNSDIIQEFSPEDEAFTSTVRTYLEEYNRSVIDNYLEAQAQNISENAHIYGNLNNATTRPVYTSDFMSLNYGNVSLLPTMKMEVEKNALLQTDEPQKITVSGIENSSVFLRTAFSLALYEISQPIIVNSHVLVLQYIAERSQLAHDTETNANSIQKLQQDDLQTFFSKDLDIQIKRAFIQDNLLKDNFNSAYQRYTQK